MEFRSDYIGIGVTQNTVTIFCLSVHTHLWIAYVGRENLHVNWGFWSLESRYGSLFHAIHLFPISHVSRVSTLKQGSRETCPSTVHCRIKCVYVCDGLVSSPTITILSICFFSCSCYVIKQVVWSSAKMGFLPFFSSLMLMQSSNTCFVRHFSNFVKVDWLEILFSWQCISLWINLMDFSWKQSQLAFGPLLQPLVTLCCTFSSKTDMNTFTTECLAFSLRAWQFINELIRIPEDFFSQSDQLNFPNYFSPWSTTL